jgi:lipopolysaccharide/colanic/teichoic acid biosynthesis glycosyltransferase
MKRIFDLMFAVFWIVLTAPLVLLIALLIKLDSSGPVLYTPQMIGKDGKLFRLLRFRTMYVDKRDSRSAAERFTRVGRFIRNYSLDHLPSLLNVLKGDLSIIGPRPMEPEFVDMQDPRWQRYFQVRSGLLNYAVLKLGKTFGPSRANNLALKQELELEYIEKQSLAFDCQLLLEVIRAHIASKGNIKMRGLPSPEIANGQSVYSGLHDDAVHGS